MERTIYRELKVTPAVWLVALLLLAFIGAAGLAVLMIEEEGHIITGMNNQIVWGLPHVFAIFLIVAASGVLNVASISSVFGKKAYKPMARFSALLSITVLLGGLAILVLDLGRPDRLIVAMTRYNFTSIFAWNMLLYNGFFAIVGGYLVVQMMPGASKTLQKAAGVIAFTWRLILTTGTGSIFGWLVARPGYDAAIMAPMFIAMSFAFGLALFILVTLIIFRLDGRIFGDKLMRRMGSLLGVFAAAVLYFTIAQHLTNLYAQEHQGFERFILRDGGIYTTLFWVGHVLIGTLIPMALVFLRPSRGSTIWASILVILGGFAQLYVIVIGGQAYPLEIFPGYEVLEGFNEGVINSYNPTIYELALGLGGVALALLAAGIGAKVLRVLPTNLSDANYPTDG
ncbi:MAG TPA: molybdopterin oxidoreductase [Aliiroseovarius sp.]|nr:molybdopterin oxidoreductase [Aliiroseovarius sp.]